jgi:hypothetical protein
LPDAVGIRKRGQCGDAALQTHPQKPACHLTMKRTIVPGKSNPLTAVLILRYAISSACVVFPPVTSVYAISLPRGFSY